MPKSREYPYVAGPYRHRDQWRCKIFTGAGTYVWGQAAESETGAREIAEGIADHFRTATRLSVGSLVEKYLEFLRVNDRKTSTIDATRVKLRMLLSSKWDVEAASISDKRAREIYADLTAACAAATHHEALSRARCCWAWALQDGLVKANPWTVVRKIGKAKRGKTQLTIDEARTLMTYCEARAMADDGALATLLALLCGLRVSEIVNLKVRSIDDAGRKVRISTTKTEAGKRDPEIPENLQPAIAERLRNRRADERLLPALDEAPRGGRQWMQRQVHRFCEEAGVTQVCPHGLRGGLASLAYEAGALPHLIAALLGHKSSAVTERHYANPEAVQGAKQRRHLGILQGGKPG